MMAKNLSITFPEGLKDVGQNTVKQDNLPRNT